MRYGKDEGAAGTFRNRTGTKTISENGRTYKPNRPAHFFDVENRSKKPVRTRKNGIVFPRVI